MNRLFPLFFAIFVASNLNGTPRYPLFQGEVCAFDAGSKFNTVLQAYPLLKKHLTDEILPDAQLEEQLKAAAASCVTPRTWSIVNIEGKMPLPQVLITNEGFNGAGDNMFRVDSLATQNDQTHLIAYGFFWGKLLDQNPRRAFEILASKALSPSVTSFDVVILTACITSIPGRTLEASPNKADWAALIASKNPCYRFLGLEFFDSVPQSPDELLSLYRQCLFGACSYLEVRALNAIMKHQDYRETVAKLLEEYEASQPAYEGKLNLYTFDDGTLSKFRDPSYENIPSSAYVLKRIRDHIAKHGEKLPEIVFPKEKATLNSANVVKPKNPEREKPNPILTPQTFWGILAAILATLGIAIARRQINKRKPTGKGN